MNENTPISSAPAEKGSTRNRNIALGVGGAVLLLLACCCLAAVLIVVADPFDLNLYSRLFGGYDAAASAMPKDTNVYMGVNLLNLRSDKAAKIVGAFNPNGEDIQTSDDLIKMLDQDLMNEVDMSITEDVLPWIGQYAGFGFTELVFDEYGSVENAGFVLSVEARDTKKADAFLVKLQDSIENSYGGSFPGFTQETYQGVTITELNADYEEERVAFARSKSLVLFGTGTDSLKKAIDAQKSDGLTANSNYKNLIGKLPGDQMVTLYMNMKDFQGVMNTTLGNEFGLPTNSLNYSAISEVAMSISLADAGLQMDTAYLYDTNNMSSTQIELMKTAGSSPRSPEYFPEETFVFASGQRLDLVWKVYTELYAEMMGSSDVDESMQMLADEIGINPNTDLMPYLDGEWALGVMPDTTGVLAEQANVNLGLALSAETSNSSALLGSLRQFNGNLETMGVSINETQEKDLTLCGLEDSYSGSEMLAYGLDKQLLILGTSGDLVSMYAKESSLAQSANYQEVWKAFPNGMAPILYIDMGGLVGAIRQSVDSYALSSFDETVQYLEPITYIAAGASPVQDNIGRSTLIVFIPTE